MRKHLLFILIIFVPAVILAGTNFVTGMATAYILNFFEKKPDGYDAPIDIKVDD